MNVRPYKLSRNFDKNEDIEMSHQHMPNALFWTIFFSGYYLDFNISCQTYSLIHMYSLFSHSYIYNMIKPVLLTTR